MSPLVRPGLLLCPFLLPPCLSICGASTSHHTASLFIQCWCLFSADKFYHTTISFSFLWRCITVVWPIVWPGWLLCPFLAHYHLASCSASTPRRPAILHIQCQCLFSAGEFHHDTIPFTFAHQHYKQHTLSMNSGIAAAMSGFTNSAGWDEQAPCCWTGKNSQVLRQQCREGVRADGNMVAKLWFVSDERNVGYDRYDRREKPQKKEMR